MYIAIMRVKYIQLEMPFLFEDSSLYNEESCTYLASHKADPSLLINDHERYKNFFKNAAGHSPVLLSGSSEVFYLSHTWQSDLALAGIEVHVLDCAIRFNPFLLSEEAFRRGFAAEDVLSRVRVQRGFTPYQILDATKQIYEKLDNGEQFVPVFLAPAKQFLDGDVAGDEGEFLLNRLLHQWDRFRQKRFPLVIIEKESYRHSLFQSFFQKLEHLARSHWALCTDSIDQRNSVYRLEKKSRKIPESEALPG